MTRAAEALIDQDALRHNLRAERVATSRRRVMAVIKAKAYGHGSGDVARALHESDAFAVACLDEAMTLRGAGIAQLIVLLEGFFSAEELPLLSRHRLILVLHFVLLFVLLVCVGLL